MQNVVVCTKCKRWVGFSTLPVTCAVFCWGCSERKNKQLAKARALKPSPLFGDTGTC